MKKKNSRLLIHKAYLITGVELIYHFALNKKVYGFQTPRLAGLCETTWYLTVWKHATSRPPLQRSHMRRRLTSVLAWFGIFLSGAHWADQLLNRSFFTHTVSIELNAALAVMPSSRQLSFGNAKNVLSAVTGVNLQNTVIFHNVRTVVLSLTWWLLCSCRLCSKVKPINVSYGIGQ